MNDFDEDGKLVKIRRLCGQTEAFVGTLDSGGAGRVNWMKSWWLASATSAHRQPPGV